MIRLIAKDIDDNNVGGWFAEQMYWTLGIIGVVIAVFFLVEIVNIIYSRNHAKQLVRDRNNAIAAVNQVYDAKRQKQIDEVLVEAQNMAEELKQIAESYNEI